MVEANMVNPSSSDTEEALDLLFLSPARDPRSPISKPRSSFDDDLFEDWPDVNDMAMSVYVALSVDASSSWMLAVDALCDDRESCASSSSTRKSSSWVASSRKPRRQKTVLTGAPRKKSKKTKINVEHALALPTPCGSSLLPADFDRSEWEIMYPLFVAEGLVDPFEHVNGRNT
jgi:hypothetical protein